MPQSEPIYLTLKLDEGEDSDPASLDRAARDLLPQIKALDVESASLARSGDVPQGAKVGEVVALGTLAVTLLPTVAPKLIELLQAWSLRGENRSVKIKAQSGDRSIEVEYSPKAMPADELKRIVSVIAEALPPSAPAKPPAPEGE